MKNKIRTIIILLFCAILCITIKSYALENYLHEVTEAEYVYNNVSDNHYGTWATPIRTYLYENADGTFTRFQVNYLKKIMFVETYTKEFVRTSVVEKAFDLPLFGGFYVGSTYNFLVTGQTNPDEDATIPVIRIEKLTKDWKVVGTLDLKDCNTTVPFDAGSCRMDEYNGTLFISTCHEMYKTSDGYNHQSNLGIEVKIDTMECTYLRDEIMNTSIGYVSHSFNQFIEVENDYVYTVDHGDANPRGVALFKRKIGQRYVENYKNVYSFGGEKGDNSTGATIGGFELSENNCIIAGSTVDQNATEWTRNGVRNIFITIAPKNDFASAKTIYLTEHDSDSWLSAQTPHLVKINNNKFAVLWEEGDYGVVRIALIDENANLIGDVYTIDGYLSDCKPYVIGETLYWYTSTHNSKKYFHEIDVTGLKSITSVEAPEAVTIEVGQTLQLEVNLLPLDHNSDPELTWTVFGTDLVKIDALGRITGLAEGTASVVVKTSNGVKEGIIVYVENKLIYTTLPEKTVDESEVVLINDKCTVESITNATNFPVIDKNYTVEFYSGDVLKSNSDYIGSNDVVKIKDKSGNVVKEFIVAVKGDVNGDGMVKIFDAFQILKGTIKSSTSLTNLEKIVRDYNDDENVLLYDAFQFLKKSILS